MGASTFITYGEGADIATALRGAMEDAQYEYGHRAYTGTIAEKNSYVAIDDVSRPQATPRRLLPNCSTSTTSGSLTSGARRGYRRAP
ncbi:hypothetical protein ADL03_15110 [Nocardia sp. NRRL S-836]|nr:hypothetical protein ADL03_15110 [Nocardia sp. NRRL S-836]